MTNHNVETEQTDPLQDTSVPWTAREAWMGIAILVVTSLLYVIIIPQMMQQNILESAGLLLLEILYLLPVLLILPKRNATWQLLGFRKYGKGVMGLGCGLFAGAYLLVIVHNFILMAFGLPVQGDQISSIFNSLGSPFWLFFVGILIAPVVEEVLFRGFIFSGFRQSYGWKKAALLSSAIFALAHLQPVAFVPTFILGYVFSYLCQKSNSILPGIFLHLLTNLFGLLSAFAFSQM
jgi:membrane protease YdiL (CAAX protease family)